MLEVQNISVAYAGATAVENATLTVGDGEIVAIVGANGAGKTSLLHAIAGIVRPSTGSVRWRGQDITHDSTGRRFRRGLVLVPEGRAVVSRMTVRENLLLAGREIEQARDWFPALDALWSTPAGALSGGEQQMLAIARGLVSRPEIMLLDEPSMGLSPKLAKQILRIVEDIRSQGTSVLLVEQNASQALAIADRGHVFETGRIVVEGTGPELLEHPEVVRAYLGIDTTSEDARRLTPGAP